MAYEQTFFIVPSRILDLPNITLQLVRFYETIFQFWNKGKNCFLSNELIKERTGMKSDSTVSDAFQYFEENKEMKRIYKGSKRYIVQTLFIEHSDEDGPLPCERGKVPVDNLDRKSVV